MHKKITITLDEAVYNGLWRTVGKRRMSRTYPGKKTYRY